MRSLDVPSAAPALVLQRFRAAIVAALLAAIVFTGCDSPPSGPKIPAAIVVPRTPEEKFDRAMERMESALADAQAAAGTGVVSERTSDYRLIPPTDEGGQYTAEVTLRTKLSLARAPAAATLPRTDEEKAAEEAAAEDGELDEEGEIVPDNGVTRKALALSRDEQTDVYKLAYEGDRWKLLTKPKGETEQLIFEYALGK